TWFRVRTLANGKLGLTEWIAAATSRTKASVPARSLRIANVTARRTAAEPPRGTGGSTPHGNRRLGVPVGSGRLRKYSPLHRQLQSKGRLCRSKSACPAHWQARPSSLAPCSRKRWRRDVDRRHPPK